MKIIEDKNTFDKKKSLNGSFQAQELLYHFLSTFVIEEGPFSTQIHAMHNEMIKKVAKTLTRDENKRL